MRQNMGLASVIVLVTSEVGWVGAQLVAFGTLLKVFTGMPLGWGIVISAAVVIVYTILGGMWSVTITDVIQMMILSAGLIIILPFAADHIGGWSQLFHQAGNWNDLPTWAFAPTKDAGYLGYFGVPGWFYYVAAWMAIGLGSIPAQDLMQRVLSAKSDKVAVRSSYYGAILYLTIGMIPVLLGVAMFEVHPNLTIGATDDILPWMAMQWLPPILTGVFVAAIVAALMSSCDSALLAIAARIGYNALKFGKPDASSELTLKTTRAVVPIAALVATLMALYLETIYMLVVIAWSIILVGLFAPFAAGYFWKKCNGSAALSGGTLRLTPAQAEQAGAAFYTTRFPSGDFRAFLDLTIAGGPEGGEGATFLWIRDETAEGALGGTGGALGFWGGALTGYAVEFDTVLSPDFGDPSGNHAALNDSRSGDGHSLAAFDLPVPLKGTGTFHVEVGCLQGLVTVTVANPAQGYGPACVLEHQIPSYIAGQAFFGFSGATGSLASEQRIDNFVLQIPNIPPDPPVPEFTAAPTRGTAPLTSMFTNLTTGEVQSFLWDFGDNLTSTRENPVHTYTAPGTYTVRLTATGPGGTAFMEKAGYITVVASEAPEADFYGVPRGGAAPLLVRFFPVVSGGAVATYEWDFGDGTTSAAAYPEHAYEQAGAFTVTLRVSGPGGSDVAEKPEYIEVSPPPEPEPAFAASPTAGAVPLQTAFTNLTAYADRVDSWLWDFGDGATSTEANPVHRYIAAGLYSVRLTAFYGAKSRDSYREDYIDCLLYTSDAADDLLCVDLGGRRTLKKKKQKEAESPTHKAQTNNHNH